MENNTAGHFYENTKVLEIYLPIDIIVLPAVGYNSDI